MKILRDKNGRFIKGTKAINPYKKGHIPWSKGQKGVTLNTGRTHFKKGQFADEKHPFWKGNKVGYLALHSWVKRKLGTPNKCEKCKTTKAKKFEWANISGEYRRDFTDWIRLCTVCHHKLDDIANKGWKTKRGQIFASL